MRFRDGCPGGRFRRSRERANQTADDPITCERFSARALNRARDFLPDLGGHPADNGTTSSSNVLRGLKPIRVESGTKTMSSRFQMKDWMRISSFSRSNGKLRRSRSDRNVAVTASL